jgi:hypothetical protein
MGLKLERAPLVDSDDLVDAVGEEKASIQDRDDGLPQGPDPSIDIG